jgi:glycerophosphoryl diester phosphodiesterase
MAMIHQRLGFAVVGALVLLGSAVTEAARPARDTAEDFLTLPGITAIAHRGYGANLGEDPTRPIENTVPAVRRAFHEGATVVEVDVVLTRDGEVVALHDDVLADLTCVNTLALSELRARLPYVATLDAILKTAKPLSIPRDERVTGIVIVELKPASPRCDPADASDALIVSSVVGVIRTLGMERQVLLDSLSPALLALASMQAPEIARQLTISVLQFATPEEIEQATGLTVTPIDKGPLGLGLAWGEVGDLFRLPGYVSPAQALGVAFSLGSRSIAIDLSFLALAEMTAPGSAAAFVAAVHGLGMRAAPYSVSTLEEWLFAASFGADAIYVDDVALGLRLQSAPCVRTRCRR